MRIKKVIKKTEATHKESAFDGSVAPVLSDSHPQKGKRVKVIIGISLTTIVIFGTGLNLSLHYQKSQNLQKNPVMTSEMEQESIVSKVAKLIELPNFEQPTIATVTDITKLEGQPFFQRAKNGDVVLIYTKANLAILYDPSADKILELGPINSGQETALSSNAAVAGASTQARLISPTPAALNVALYNGTTIDGLTRKIQAQLAQTMPNVTVINNTNAVKQDYAKTIVIDLTGKQSAAAQQLAKVLNGTVGTMPPSETVPVNADILVILGKQN